MTERHWVHEGACISVVCTDAFLTASAGIQASEVISVVQSIFLKMFLFNGSSLESVSTGLSYREKLLGQHRKVSLDERDSTFTTPSSKFYEDLVLLALCLKTAIESLTVIMKDITVKRIYGLYNQSYFAYIKILLIPQILQ